MNNNPHFEWVIAVFSSACFYVSKLLDNPLHSQQDIRLEAMISFTKAYWSH